MSPLPESVRDYYGLLGVARDATGEEIKRAYRKLARELHPDVNPDLADQNRFKEVTTAYEVLSDPEKRRIVDLGGDPLGGGGQGGTAGNPFGGFTGGLGDVFDMFFGGNASGGGRGPRSRVRPGADALLRLDLTMAEAALGVHRDIAVDTAVICTICHGDGCSPGTHARTCDICHGSGEVQSVQRSLLGQVMTTRPCPACAGTGEQIPNPCPTCGGDGRVRAQRSISVDVPAGVEDGMRIRLTGQGEVGPGGGPAGDLYVEIHELANDVFTRDGADLHCSVSVPMTAAALGTEVPVTGLDGQSTMVDIRPGTQAGAVITMRGLGVVHLRDTRRGDLYIHIDVRTPTKLDPEQEKLLREFAGLRDEHVSLSSARSGLLHKFRDVLNGGR